MTWQINSLNEWHSPWITRYIYIYTIYIYIYTYIQSVNVSNILRGGSIHQNKKKKKSNKHGSENAYFLRSVHLSIVADDVWLWVRLRDIQYKHRGNKYCMCTVVAEGQRDALPWTDVTLSNSYNKCHEWTSGWTSPMNKCTATGHREYVFPDPCVIVFFMLWYALPPLTIIIIIIIIIIMSVLPKAMSFTASAGT